MINKIKWFFYKRHCRKVYEFYQDEPYWRERYKVLKEIADGEFDDLHPAVHEVQQLVRYA